jgi:hypothetical protein
MRGLVLVEAHDVSAALVHLRVGILEGHEGKSEQKDDGHEVILSGSGVHGSGFSFMVLVQGSGFSVLVQGSAFSGHPSGIGDSAICQAPEPCRFCNVSA